eukprot:534762-Hanusia_phi.AAC.1
MPRDRNLVMRERNALIRENDLAAPDTHLKAIKSLETCRGGDTVYRFFHRSMKGIGPIQGGTRSFPSGPPPHPSCPKQAGAVGQVGQNKSKSPFFRTSAPHPPALTGSQDPSFTPPSNEKRTGQHWTPDPSLEKSEIPSFHAHLVAPTCDA